MKDNKYVFKYNPKPMKYLKDRIVRALEVSKKEILFRAPKIRKSKISGALEILTFSKNRALEVLFRKIYLLGPKN